MVAAAALAVPWYCWALLANVLIMVIEYLNRTGEYPHYFAALLHTAPLIFIAQAGLHYSWKLAPSMMLAWAVFTTGNCLLRLVNTTWMVGEVPSMQTLAGVALLMAGVFMVKSGGVS